MEDMKKILELEELQSKVNDQIMRLGEANHEDADKLEALYDSLTPEEIDIVIDRYCGKDNEEEYDEEFENHMMEVRSYE
jgi:hypothetical protein